jgi:uncharacterized delta-60 repeat protein
MGRGTADRFARVLAYVSTLVMAGAIAMLVVPAAPSSAAAGSVNMTLSVLSATTLDTSGCNTGTTYDNAVTADTPLHWWHLGEKSGTAAAPAAGAVSGTYAGTYTLGRSGAIAGNTDTSVKFAGGAGGGVVNLAGLGVNTAAGAYNTVEFWMRWDGSDDVVPFGFFNLNLWINGGRFGFNTSNGDIYGINGAAVSSLANRWVHVAAVYRNNDYTQGKLYIDGVQQTLSQLLGTQDTTKGATTNAYIGGTGWSPNFRFTGRIDEVSIYAGQLSASRIQAHYAAGVGNGGSARDFGTVQPGQKAVTTADCEVTFGATNDSSQLRAAQTDGAGSATYKPSNGTFDTSFSGDGVNTNPGYWHYDVTPYGDGSFVSVGETNSAGWQFGITRWNSNGTVQWSSSPAQPGCADCMAFGVDVVSGGDILVGGHYDTGTNYEAALMRLKPDGTLRTTWNGVGYSRLTRAGEQQVYDVLEQPGRGYLAIGTSYEGASLAAFVLRYDALGQLDTSFGSGGMAILQLTGGPDRAYQAQLQSDGSILVAGNANGDLFVTRLTPNGQLDTTFGTGGTTYVDTNTTDAWEQEKVGMMLDPRTGDIVAAIEYGNSSATSQIAVAKMDPDGQPVGNFGSAGLVRYDLFPGLWEDVDGVYVEGDGRITVPFVREDDADSGWALRLLPNGTRDATFGSNGLIELLNATTDDQYGMEVTSDSDGRLVAVGGEGISRVTADTIPDVVGGSQDWDQGSGMFGACLRSLTGGTTDVTTWTLDANGDCTSVDTDPWNPITAAGSKVARRTTPGFATARLRFGVRPPAATRPGAYEAPIRFSVIAPDP